MKIEIVKSQIPILEFTVPEALEILKGRGPGDPFGPEILEVFEDVEALFESLTI